MKTWCRWLKKWVGHNNSKNKIEKTILTRENNNNIIKNSSEKVKK